MARSHFAATVEEYTTVPVSGLRRRPGNFTQPIYVRLFCPVRTQTRGVWSRLAVLLLEKIESFVQLVIGPRTLLCRRPLFVVLLSRRDNHVRRHSIVLDLFP